MIALDAARPPGAEQHALRARARLRPGDPAANGVVAYRLTGDVDPVRLRLAVERVVRAGAGLDTVVDGSGGPRARVERDAVPRVAPTAAGSEAAALAHVRLVAGTPLAPDRRPYDLCVWTVPEGMLLTAVVAPAVGGAHALRALLDDIALEYAAPAHADPDARRRRAGDPAAVPTDDPRAHAAAVAFFTDQLAGLEGLDCGLTARRDRAGRLAGVTDTLALGAGRSAAVHAFARAHGVTPSAVLLTAFVITLSALSGRERVVVGVPVGDRHPARGRPGAGPVVTTLPLAVAPGEHATAVALARHLDATTVRLSRHRGLDLRTHAAEVLGARRPARLDLDAVLTHHPRPLVPELPGVAVTRLDVVTPFVGYPLGVTAEQTPDGLVLVAEHSHDLVPSRPLHCLRTVLDGLLAHPGAAPARLPLLDEGHRRDVDALINLPAPVTGRPHTLWDGFVATATERGDAVAVQDDTGASTYGELLDRARAYARGLVARVPGPYVGVSLPRSRQLVAVLLGVLGAGKAVVPVDPGAPLEHARHVLGRFAALPVVAGPDSLPGLDVVRLDPDALVGPAGPQPAGPGPDDLAYVLPTSGSTGRPRDVQVSHRNLTHFLVTAAEHVEVDPDDVWCSLHPTASDTSVFEIYGALLSGGRLVVPSGPTTGTPTALRDLLVRTGVTVLSPTPSGFAPLLALLGPADVDRLAVRRLVVRGEAVPALALRRWFDLTGRRTRVFDVHGPTECSVWATWHEVTVHDADADADAGTGRVIGWPRRGLRVEVVDAALRPLPAGAPGELLVEGPAVARGYRGRPDLTAERFVALPGGGTAYRTGDVVRLRADGRLVLLGRSVISSF